MKKLLTLTFLVVLLAWKTPQQTSQQDPPIQVKDGFKVERLFAPGDSEMGSWVSLAHVDDNRFVASDQYGKIYWIDVPPIGGSGSVEVSPFAIDSLGKAQGLLWAYNSLYVMINDRDKTRSGLYRVTDDNGDGELDNATFLQNLNGWGEHGPHGVILGPDGLLYLIAGNHTDVPENFGSIQTNDWREDRLYESMKDPNGHAIRRGAPGGWIARTDSVGSFWEVYANGFRNAYDIAFNDDGELFTFDSDMEWDMGLPWYRPIRVCHIIPGAEFGWRTGSAKWPTYYPDNLPGILDVGQGSPTGVISASGLSYPAPFDKGLFICDWSFGTMYHVGLTPKGASYEGEMTEFLSGVPLPLTDVAVGQDGAMYFTTGGRRLESGLFRVWYDGDITTTDSERPIEASRRKELETFQNASVQPDRDLIWSELDSDDRFVQYAARIALENQGVQNWMDREGDAQPMQLIPMGIAAARTGSASDQQRLFERLSSIDASAMSIEDQLGLIRAQGLLMSRNDQLSSSTLTEQWIGQFPSPDRRVNEELAFLFMDTKDDRWLPKVFAAWREASDTEEGIIIADSVAQRSKQYGGAVMNLRKRRPAAHKISLMYAMANYQVGWTDDMRKDYFVGFNGLWDREGGHSYRGYITTIMEKALEPLSAEKQADYRALSGADLGQYGSRMLRDLPVPEGPGQHWTVENVETLMSRTDLLPNFENGAKMFDAALCRACHSMQGKGSSLGPELTQLGTRFSIKDMAIALVDPDAEVSDQYRVTELVLKDESMVRGKVVKIESDTLHVMVNPLAPEYLQKVPAQEVVSETASANSWMFPAMLNRLNEQEVYDLMSYLQAAGDASHETYQD